jgi:hypothetical protein
MDQTAPSTPRVPFRLVLASIAGVWLAYFALTTLRGWLVGLELFDALLLRRGLVTVASMAVTLALWPLVRLLDPRPFWVKVGAVLLMALPASVLLAAINQAVFADIENKVVATIGEREGLRIRSDESGNLLVDPLDREAEAAARSAPLPAAAPRDYHRRRDPRRQSPAPTGRRGAGAVLSAAGLGGALFLARQCRTGPRSGAARGSISPRGQGLRAAVLTLSG